MGLILKNRWLIHHYLSWTVIYIDTRQRTDTLAITAPSSHYSLSFTAYSAAWATLFPDSLYSFPLTDTRDTNMGRCFRGRVVCYHQFRDDVHIFARGETRSRAVHVVKIINVCLVWVRTNNHGHRDLSNRKTNKYSRPARRWRDI
jgi:hypothetical protein